MTGLTPVRRTAGALAEVAHHLEPAEPKIVDSGWPMAICRTNTRSV